MDERSDSTDDRRRPSPITRLLPAALRPRRRAEDRPVAGNAPTQAAERWLRAQAVAGEREAWAAIVEAHVAGVWDWALQEAREPAIAAEICELVWLRFGQALSQLDEPVEAWLRRAVRDEAARARRARPVPPQRRPLSM